MEGYFIHPEVLHKKDVLKSVSKFTRKHLYRGLFLDLRLYYKETPAHVLSCLFHEIFKNYYFTELLPKASTKSWFCQLLILCMLQVQENPVKI